MYPHERSLVASMQGRPFVLLGVNSDPKEKVEALLAAREPLYRECADLSLDSANLDAEVIACGILESARYHFAHGA